MTIKSVNLLLLGILLRNESLAARFGVKGLTGPLLLKSFEKLFDGPITVLEAHYGHTSRAITWLDIVEFARTNPRELILDANRSCKFWINQVHVQISEDDYRLILSKAPERMIPSSPIAEDEAYEQGTLDILEQRLTMLIKKADLVAGRARQLNYHLKGRKTAIVRARSSSSQSDGRDHQIMAAPFQPINQPDHNTNGHDLRDELLRQFSTDDKHSAARLKPERSSSDHFQSHRQGATHSPAAARRQSQPSTSSVDDGSGGLFRPLMTANIEKLARGENIWPPCDRCRRLTIGCTKHLTACSGCTKKHAKCTWKNVTGEEAAYLSHSSEVPPAPTGAEGSQSDRIGIQARGQQRVEASADLGAKEQEVVSNRAISPRPSSRQHNNDAPHTELLTKERHNSIADQSTLSQMAVAAAATASSAFPRT